MLAPATKKQTVADYAALPEGAPYQLIDGALVMSPSPSFSHQAVTFELGVALRSFVKQHDLGTVLIAPLDVFLTEHDAYQPDLLYVARERRDLIEEDGVHGAPDLVVEVLSPSTGYYDLRHKKRVYADAGVQEYWIVDPLEQTVEVWRLGGDDVAPLVQARETGTVQSELLDGFSVDLETLFADLQ